MLAILGAAGLSEDGGPQGLLAPPFRGDCRVQMVHFVPEVALGNGNEKNFSLNSAFGPAGLE